MTLFSFHNPLLHHPPKYLTKYLVTISSVIPQLRRIAAMEVREYRNVSKKLVEIEERGKLLATLISKKLGLNGEKELYPERACKVEK